MLSIAKMAAGQEEYYLDLGQEDYYLEGGEPLGQWEGQGARALGLQGVVQADHLRALMAGCHPRDGGALGQLQDYHDGRSRQPGWDLTFSAPKSVSVLWALAPDELRSEIARAHAAAVRDALDYLEDSAGFARRGRGGAALEPAQLVFATFEHGTSRAQDPQLHTHCLALNVGRRQDGSWGSIRSRDLYQHKMAAGALYRVGLAEGLSRLSIELAPEATWFEVGGIPKTLRDTFSRRRAEIEELQARFGVASAKANEAFALFSRQRKGHVARNELVAHWRGMAEGLGFGERQVRRLVQGASHTLRPTLDPAFLPQAVQELTDTDATFTQRDLVRRVAEKCQASGIRAADLVDRLRKFLATDSRVAAITVGDGPYPIYTSADLLRFERRLLDAADRLHAQQTHGADDRHVHRAFALHSHLNDEQRDAVRRITAPSRLVLLSGMAGSGKTSALIAAREAWERQGFRVLGTALSGRAAAELRSAAGIKSSTIESLLYRVEPNLKRTLSHHARMLLREAAGKPTWKAPRPGLGSDTVLVVDEAAMVGTRHLARILTAVEKSGCKVVLVGDEGQLQSIDAGGGFKALRRKLGAAELRQIRRQHEEWMRRAVHEFAEGDARGGLSRYAAAGCLHVGSTREQTIASLVDAWSQQRTPDLSKTLILAGRNQDATELNLRAQEARRLAGDLGRSAPLQDGQVHEGDRIMFLASSKPLGVLNGDLGTVERIQEGVIDVRLDRRQVAQPDQRHVRVSLRPADLTVRAFGEKRDLMGLGYACTVHKAQGATVDSAFVLAGGWMQDRELSYVQMSRARGACQVFVDDASAGEDLVELERTMARSRQKLLAHDQILDVSQSQGIG